MEQWPGVGSISCCVGMCCGAVARCWQHIVLCRDVLWSSGQVLEAYRVV